MYGDDAAGMSASAWRKFESEIQSCLLTFEKAREWADLSICLQRLHKTVSRPPSSPFTGIPCLIAIAKKLAQCLNPTLPSGIHARSLMVYEALMHRLGPERLVTCFPIFMMGLHSFYPQAATTVRNVYFDMFESLIKPILKHFVSFQFDLLSCLVVSGEDEKCPEFQRFCDFISGCESAWGLEAVAQCLWSVAAKLVTHRLGALRTLERRIEAAQGSYTHRDLSERVFANVAVLEAAACCLLPCDEMLEAQPTPQALTRETSSSAPSAKGQLNAVSLCLAQRLVMDFLASYVPITSDLISTSRKVKLMSALLPLADSKDVGVKTRVNHWLFSLDPALAKGCGEESTQSSFVADDFPMFKACAALVASRAILSEVSACEALLSDQDTSGPGLPTTPLQHWAIAKGLRPEALLLQCIKYLILESSMAVSIRLAIMPSISFSLCEYLAKRRGYIAARRKEDVSSKQLLNVLCPEPAPMVTPVMSATADSVTTTGASLLSCVWLRHQTSVCDERVDLVDCDATAIEIYAHNREDSVSHFYNILRAKLLPLLHIPPEKFTSTDTQILERILICGRFYLDCLSDPLSQPPSDDLTSGNSSQCPDGGSPLIPSPKLDLNETPSADDTVVNLCTSTTSASHALTSIQSRHVVSLLCHYFALLCETLSPVNRGGLRTLWLASAVHLAECLRELEAQVKLATPGISTDFQSILNDCLDLVVKTYADSDEEESDLLVPMVMAMSLWCQTTAWIQYDDDTPIIQEVLIAKHLNRRPKIFMSLALLFFAKGSECAATAADLTDWIFRKETQGCLASKTNEEEMYKARLIGSFFKKSNVVKELAKRRIVEVMGDREDNGHNDEGIITALKNIYRVVDLEVELDSSGVELLVKNVSEISVVVLQLLSLCKIQRTMLTAAVLGKPGLASPSSLAADMLLAQRRTKFKFALQNEFSMRGTENFFCSIVSQLLTSEFEVVFPPPNSTLETVTYKFGFATEQLVDLLNLVEVVIEISSSSARELWLLNVEALERVSLMDPPSDSSEESFEDAAMTPLYVLAKLQPSTLMDLLRLQLLKIALARSSQPLDEDNSKSLITCRTRALGFFHHLACGTSVVSIEKARETYALYGRALVLLYAQACRDHLFELASAALEVLQSLRIMGQANDYCQSLVSEVTLWNLTKAGCLTEASHDVEKTLSHKLSNRINFSLLYGITRCRDTLPVRDDVIFESLKTAFQVMGARLLVDASSPTECSAKDCFVSSIIFLTEFCLEDCHPSIMLSRLESALQIVTLLLTETVHSHYRVPTLIALTNLVRRCLSMSEPLVSPPPHQSQSTAESLRAMFRMYEQTGRDVTSEDTAKLSESFTPKWDQDFKPPNVARWMSKVVMLSVPQVLATLESTPETIKFREYLMCMMWDMVLPTFIQVIHHAWATLSLESRPESEQLRASFIKTLVELPCFDLTSIWKETTRLLEQSDDHKPGENFVFKLRHSTMYQLLYLLTKSCTRFDKSAIRQCLLELIEVVVQHNDQPVRLIWVLDLVALVADVAPLNRDMMSLVNAFKTPFNQLLTQVMAMYTATSVSKQLDLIPPMPLSVAAYEAILLNSVHSSCIQGSKATQQRVVRPSLSPYVKTEATTAPSSLETSTASLPPASNPSRAADEAGELQLKTELIVSHSPSDLLNQYAVEALLNFILCLKKSMDGISMACLRLMISHSPLVQHLINVLVSQSGLQTCTALHYLSLHVLNELMQISLKLVTDTSAVTVHAKPVLSNILPFGSTGMLDGLIVACQTFIIKVSKAIREWFQSASLDSVLSHDRRTTQMNCQLVHSAFLGTMLKINNFVIPPNGDLAESFGSRLESLDDFLTQPSLGIFTTWGSEIALRSAYLTRVSFALLSRSMRPLTNDLDNILSRVADYSRIANKEQSGDLKVKVMVLLRMLLFRAIKQSSPQLWSFLLAECTQTLFQYSQPSILYGPDIASKLTSSTPLDFNLLLATLKLLDLMSLLRPKFSHHQLFFPSINLVPPAVDASDAPRDSQESLESSVNQKSASDDQSGRNTPRASGNFIPLLELLAQRLETIQKAKGCPSVSGGLVAKLALRASILRSEVTKDDRRQSNSSFASVETSRFSLRGSPNKAVEEIVGPSVVANEVRSIQQLLKLIETLCLAHVDRQTYLLSDKDWTSIERNVEEEFMALPAPLIDWAAAITPVSTLSD